MVFVGKLFITISFILTSLYSVGQAYTVDVVNSWNILTHTPADTSSKTPAIFFFTGSGEAGSDTAEAALYGPIFQFRNGWNGTARGIEFWIFHVQSSGSGTYTESLYRSRMSAVLAKHPSIDTNRIYLTGLSMGGGAIMNQIDTTVSGGLWYKYVAIVPMSIGGTQGTQVRYAQPIMGWVRNGGKYYGLRGDSDGTRPMTPNFADTFNLVYPYSAQYYEYVGGHNGWENEYKYTTKRMNSENIYEWMLKHSKRTYAKAPNDFSSSSKTFTLNGLVDSIQGGHNGWDRTITWSKVSGPGTVSFVNSSLDTTNATVSVDGVYVLRLNSSNAAGGHTSEDEVTVTVDSALPPSDGNIFRKEKASGWKIIN